MGVEGYKRLDPERAHIVSVVTACVKRKQWTETQRLVKSINKYLNLQGYWNDHETVLQTGLIAAKELKDLHIESKLLIISDPFTIAKGNRTKPLTIMSAPSPSLSNWATPAALAVPIIISAAPTIAKGNRTKPLTIMSAPSPSLSNWATPVALAVPIIISAAPTIAKGNPDKAIDYHERALAIFEQLGDTHNMISSLGKLSSAYHRKGEPDKAIDYFNQVLFLHRKLRNHSEEHAIPTKLGTSYHFLDYLDKVTQSYQEARTLNPNDADTLNSLFKVYTNLRHLHKAHTHYQRKIELHPEDDLTDHVISGVLTVAQGQENEGQNHFETALAVWEKAEENQIRSPFELLEYKAIALLCTGKLDEALHTLKQALDQLQPQNVIDSTLYDLLASAPNPPKGIDKMHHMLQKAQDETTKKL